jgi:hypothetical protein
VVIGAGPLSLLGIGYSSASKSMTPDLFLLKRNVARVREEIRRQSREVQTLADAGLDFTGAVRVLEHLRQRLSDYLDILTEVK